MVPDAWRDPYRVTVEEIDAELPADVDGAAELVRAFIDAIDASQ